MSLTKKEKFLLKWLTPASFLVLGVSIAAPIVVVSQQNNEKLVRNSENIIPDSFVTLSDTYLSSLKYNPKNYDIRFFSQQIISSYLRNEVFAFEGSSKIETDLKDGTKNVYWKDSNGVCYYIDKAEVVLDQGTNSYLQKPNSQGQQCYVFKLDIYKYKLRATQIKYQEEVLIPTSDFVNEKQSRNNFLALSAKKLNEIFINKEEILTFKTDDTFTNIEELNDTNDIKLVERNDVDNYIKQYEKPNKDAYYSLEWNDFIYISDFVTFFVPFTDGSQKLVWNSTDAYSFDLDGNFNINSPLFQFLLKHQKEGNLPYLPELSAEEKVGLNTEEQIVNRQIQKLIFNPEIQPFTFDSRGNKIPILNQAVLVEMDLGNQATTYIVVWTDLFSVSDFIVTSALELKFKANMKNGKLLTWEEITQPANLGFLTPIQEPINGLVYEITSISFASSDTYKTSPIIEVKISHPKLKITKQYQTTIVSGFQSKAYQELDNQISTILNNGTSGSTTSGQALKKLIDKTTISFNSNVTAEQVKQNITNYETLATLLSITIESLTNAKYTIDQAIINGTQIFISFKISSINDPTNFWKYNNVVQSISKTINLPTTNNGEQNPTTPTNLLKNS